MLEGVRVPKPSSKVSIVSIRTSEKVGEVLVGKVSVDGRRTISTEHQASSEVGPTSSRKGVVEGSSLEKIKIGLLTVFTPLPQRGPQAPEEVGEDGFVVVSSFQAANGFKALGRDEPVRDAFEVVVSVTKPRISTSTVTPTQPKLKQVSGVSVEVSEVSTPPTGTSMPV